MKSLIDIYEIKLFAVSKPILKEDWIQFYKKKHMANTTKVLIDLMVTNTLIAIVSPNANRLILISKGAE